MNYICKKCGKQFQNNRKRQYCFDCYKRKNSSKKSKNVSNWRQSIKERAIQYKGGKCIICGYKRCNRALVFHHLDPKYKQFGIANNGLCRSWDKVKKELDKCVLLCSNCHNEVHSNLINMEDYVQQIYICTNDKNTFQNTNKYEAISLFDEELLKQSHFFKRIRQRPATYELFKKEFEELNNNYSAMARKYNVSDNTIRKWITSYKTYSF